MVHVALRLGQATESVRTIMWAGRKNVDLQRLSGRKPSSINASHVFVWRQTRPRASRRVCSIRYGSKAFHLETMHQIRSKYRNVLSVDWWRTMWARIGQRYWHAFRPAVGQLACRFILQYRSKRVLSARPSLQPPAVRAKATLNIQAK